MKQYRYNTPVLWLSIIFPVFLMVGLLLWAIYGIIIEGPLSLYQLIVVAMPLLLLSALIGLNNPSRITVTSESICFEGFGRRHKYNWDEVEDITLKDYGYVGKSFIKIGKYRLLGGRYWVSRKLEGYKELLNTIQNQIGRK